MSAEATLRHAKLPWLIALALALLAGLAAYGALARPEPAGAVALPFRFDRGHVLVAVQLGGRETQAILDTGMPHSIVDAAYARELGLPATGRHGMMNGQRVTPLKSGALSVGGLGVADLNATDLTGLRQALDAPMVLGVSGLMDRRIVELDFRAHRLTLHPRSGFSPPAGATLIPLTARGLPWNRHYGVPVRVDGKGPVLAMFDLGADHALSVSAIAAGRVGLNASGTANYRAGGVNTSRQFHQAQARLTLGGLDLPAQTVLVGGSDNRVEAWEGNLGAQALARFHLWLDLAGRKLWLVRDPRYSLKLEETDQGLSVVTPGGPADRAGLKVGDKVRAIDGKPPLDFWQAHDSGSPAPIRFEMEDGRVVTVTPADAYR